MSGPFCRCYSTFDGKILLANNVYPDQMPQNVASDLGLHCLHNYDPSTGFQEKNKLKSHSL